jgi:hypothetical protein
VILGNLAFIHICHVNLCNIFVPNLELGKIFSMYVKLRVATNINQIGLGSLPNKFSIITTKEKTYTNNHWNANKRTIEAIMFGASKQLNTLKIIFVDNGACIIEHA